MTYFCLPYKMTFSVHHNGDVPTILNNPEHSDNRRAGNQSISLPFLLMPPKPFEQKLATASMFGETSVNFGLIVLLL